MKLKKLPMSKTTKEFSKYRKLVIAKSHQWPTPSKSIAIYWCKETSFVCYTSSVLRTRRQMKQKEKLRTAAKIKTQDYKFDPN